MRVTSIISCYELITLEYGRATMFTWNPVKTSFNENSVSVIKLLVVTAICVHTHVCR